MGTLPLKGKQYFNIFNDVSKFAFCLYEKLTKKSSYTIATYLISWELT